MTGLNSIRNRYLKTLEIHVGYYVRDESGGKKQTHPYIGLGINLSRIFKARGMKKLSTLTRYYQVPFTYAGFDLD